MESLKKLQNFPNQKIHYSSTPPPPKKKKNCSTSDYHNNSYSFVPGEKGEEFSNSSKIDGFINDLNSSSIKETKNLSKSLFVFINFKFIFIYFNKV